MSYTDRIAYVKREDALELVRSLLARGYRRVLGCAPRGGEFRMVKRDGRYVVSFCYPHHLQNGRYIHWGEVA